eukprot:gene3948-6411_t
MALPYIDDIDEATREKVNEMIADEMEKMDKPSMSKYLKHLPLPKAINLARTSMVKLHVEEMEKGQYTPPLFDAFRYDLPTPAQTARNDLTAWRASVKNGYAQLEHQKNRIDNLELMMQFGGQKWMQHLEQLKTIKETIQRRLDATSREIEDINWQRQTEQQALGQELFQLEVKWVELVSSNYQLETLCDQLEEMCKKQ